MEADFVKFEVADGVGTIRLARPPMNALSSQMQDELALAAKEAGSREDVRAVVLYGGEKLFAAGADVKEFAGMDYSAIVGRSEALTGSLTAVARIPKPVIAAVTGYALGGGCELALTADFRVCGDNAKLGQPEILLGVIPGAGGTQRMTRLIGPAKAKDLIYSGRFVDATEALAIGLVDRVVAPDEVYAEAVRWASTFVAGPPHALRAAKAAIDGGLDTDLESGLRLEGQLFAALFGTEDKRIGMASFLAEGPGKAKFIGA